MRLTKRDLLTYLSRTGESHARDIARAFGVQYSVAAMRLLRLVRQGLVNRSRAVEREAYRYTISERGQSRLAYLLEQSEAEDQGNTAGHAKPSE